MRSKSVKQIQSDSNWHLQDYSEQSFKIKTKKTSQKKIKEEITPDPLQNFYFKIEENDKQQFSEQFIEKLHEARNNLQKFMSELGHLLERNIPQFILKHIGKKKNPHKTLHFTIVKQYTKQRIDKMIKNKRIKKNWTTEDLSILIWITAKYCQFNSIKDVYYSITQEDWQIISSMIPSSTAQNCMFKWLSLKKIRKQDVQWKKREEQILMQLTKQKEDKQENIHWNQIAKKLFYKNASRNKIYRGGKQCRQRWNCFLNPKIKKGLWEKEQDIKLIRMIFEGEGQKKWSRLVPYFGGRTQNALKNRYHLLIQKQLRTCDQQQVTQTQLQKKFLQRHYMDNFFPEIDNGESKKFENKIKVEQKINDEDQNSQDQNKHQNNISFGTSLLRVIKLNQDQVQSLKEKIIQNKQDFLACRLLENGVICMDYSPPE